MAAGDVEVNISTNDSHKGAVFDGVDDDLSIPREADLEPSDFTISAWVLPYTNGEGGKGVVIEKGNTDGYYLFISNNKWDVYTSGDEIGVGNRIAVTYGEWQHLLIKQEGTVFNLYKNGVTNGNESQLAPTYTGADMTIGNRDSDGARCFDGCISDVHFWNRALSAAEVAEVYAGTCPQKDLIHRWKLREDYTDSIGSANGTNTGSYLTIVDDEIAADLAADVQVLSGAYMLTDLAGGQVVSVAIENE